MNRPVEPSPLRIVVAILTYRRPEDLAAVVPAVLAQVAEVEATARVLVIDNDPEGSALAQAGALPTGPVSVVHEPEPGIAAARNRALEESPDADALVFIDDDERPEPGWLRQLLDTWRSTGAAAVAGPVISTYPHEPDPWILAGGFFERRRPPTGTAVDVAATNNLLLDLRAVRNLGLRFDPQLGTIGGSDTLFTRLLHRGGGRILWCDEARVVDVVPTTRLTRRWVLRRSLRTGNSWSRVALLLEDDALGRTRRRAELTARGMVRVLGGAARFAVGALSRSMRHRARGARTLARGMGMVGGAWGYTYAEYRRDAAP